MPELQASRRLVKSPPELWAEVSDAASLARHLGEVGEIKITRLEPETTVAWEGERASGTVELAPAGWGTSVTLTAQPVGGADAEPEPAPEPVAAAPKPKPVAAPEPETAVAEPEHAATPEPEPSVAEPEPAPVAGEQPSPQPARRSWLARIFSRTPKPASAPEPQPSATDADRAGAPPAEPVLDEDARAAAGGQTYAHPEGHRPRSGPSGPARSSAEPEPEEPAAPEPTPDPLEGVLTQALDSLGQAHHRPFSRG